MVVINWVGAFQHPPSRLRRRQPPQAHPSVISVKRYVMLTVSSSASRDTTALWEAATRIAIEGIPRWYPRSTPVDCRYQIPILKAVDVEVLPTTATAYNKRGQASHPESTLLHFCVNDARLRPLLHQPQRYLEGFSRAWGLSTPDCSIRADAPRDLKIQAVRLNRMVGAYYQSRGFRVIPHVRWCDSRDYDYCFSGVNPGSPVMISTYGSWRAPALRDGLIRGLPELWDRLTPYVVFVYGTVDHPAFDQLGRRTQLVHLLDDWTRARKRSKLNG